jgi:protein required for attachment to host cells
MANFPLTWVVVADRARARIFEWSSVNGKLEELVDLTNPEGRLQDRAISSDRPGMAVDSQHHRSGHPMQAGHSAADNAARAFAHDIAARLGSALDQKCYERIVLVAPPGFLGDLRSALDDRVQKLVADSVGLDLTRESPEAIRQRLPTLRSLD